MVGRLLSFWNGPYLGGHLLVFGRWSRNPDFTGETSGRQTGVFLVRGSFSPTPYSPGCPKNGKNLKQNMAYGIWGNGFSFCKKELMQNLGTIYELYIKKVHIMLDRKTWNPYCWAPKKTPTWCRLLQLHSTVDSHLRRRAVLMSDAEFQPFSGTKKLPHAMYCFNKVVHPRKFWWRYSKSWCLFETYLLANMAMLIYCLGIIYGKFELG